MGIYIEDECIAGFAAIFIHSYILMSDVAPFAAWYLQMSRVYSYNDVSAHAAGCFTFCLAPGSMRDSWCKQSIMPWV